MTTLYDLLRLPSEQRKRLENIDKQINALQGHCRTHHDAIKLQALYRRKNQILKGEK